MFVEIITYSSSWKQNQHCNCYNIKLNSKNMDKYICTVCDWVYDPEIGDPEHGIAPGTKFEDIPDDWVCPLCGVGKEDFEKID